MTQSVAGVWLRNGQILLARRKNSGDMARRWEIPGGKCEDGESPQEALIREFKEELGMDISVGAACATTLFRHAGKDHEVTAFIIVAKSEITQMAEHEETAWFAFNALPSRAETVDSDADLLSQIQHRFAEN